MVSIAVIFTAAACLAQTTIASITVLPNNETFPDRLAYFGPRLSTTHGKWGNLATPLRDLTGCSVEQAPCQDWIALVRRGGCSFATKVRRMQDSGAIAVVIGDPQHSQWITMSAMDSTVDILIPSVYLRQREYRAIKSLLMLSDGPLRVHMRPSEGWTQWPGLEVVLLAVVSPSILLLLLFVSARLQQKREAKTGAPAHIVAGLPLVHHPWEKSRHETPDGCAICLEDYGNGDALRVLPCQHYFHVFCADAWLTAHKRFCPICKRDITQPANPPSKKTYHEHLDLYLTNFC